MTHLPKRLLLGRALRSDRLAQTLLPKRIALPVFASDPLSSVAYAPGEVLLVLSVAGISAYHFSPWIALAVVILLFTVVASYRQNVRAYPSGGGDYEVATTNLGRRAGLTVASALLVDYVLTVAVSISSGVENLGSAVPFVVEHKTLVAVLTIVLLTLMNLRGVRESGKLFAVPTYCFVAGVIGMIVWGVIRGAVLDHEMRAPTADFEIRTEEPGGLAGFALAFLLLRAFSSGCAALTGVEAISNGVPAFRRPKSRNAANTLAMMGLIAAVMFAGIIALALATDVKMAENPASDLLINGSPAGSDYNQDPVITQVAAAVFGSGTLPFVFLAAATALVLFLAANTAYNGFPLLGSILAQDRYLPRQLHTRGDRLAFSNGIVMLAGAAAILVVIYDADSTRLIQLYIVGVFVSFTLSQTGMVRHWNRLLAEETDPAARRRMHRARGINAFGAFFTGLVLVVVLVTKFSHGAWVSLLGMLLFYGVMTAIRRHYDLVGQELAADDPKEERVRPSRVHSIVLVSKTHKPTLRALAYAKLMRSDTLEALTISVDAQETAALRKEWEDAGIDVPLKILDSPYREITRPVVDYVKRLRTENPRDLVSVYIPEYVVGRWYEQLLHNQSALRLKGRLLYTPGVMVTSVPWQLESSELARKRLRKRAEWSAPGAVRRGPAARPGGSRGGRGRNGGGGGPRAGKPGGNGK
ncbi:APC family permease [Streptomyces sp. WMMB 322]|uniref:APC family permease n=1 Tax=Streptomyces sp. WMMB 322 TaxID=1286821 RepID=UPI0006E3553A|nr:APC family permease [Streptomyces sp. WMMB 322]SCK50348.1 amino acid/polyamine/organocation transporter, APC superfamily (TC 2.A.3) [Streptomyces sp. WMMB 322]